MSLTPLADRPEDEKPQLPDLSDSRFASSRRGATGNGSSRAVGAGRGERRPPRGRRGDDKPHSTSRHDDVYDEYETFDDDTRPTRGSTSATRLRDRRGGRGDLSVWFLT